MKKLLIAEAGEEFLAALQEYLQASYQIKVCRDGIEALQLIETFRPDALVLDLLLPGVDGVTLLQRAQEQKFSAPVLAMTRYASDYLLDALERLGVGYVMMKPCEVCAVADRLADLLAEPQKGPSEVTAPDISSIVDNVLQALSFQTHPRGYACLRQALLEILCDSNQLVTKTLYPAVGKLCGGNSKQAEQAIRRAIKQAWLYRDEEVWNSLFAARSGDKVTKCPTNKVFIMGVARYVAAYELNADTHLRKIG